MTLDSVTFSEIPEEERGCRPQICRVSAKVAEHCRLSLGQYIRLRTPHRTVVCRAFPLSVSSPAIQYDPCVTEILDSTQQSGPPRLDICRLDCKEGKEVKVKLVLRDTWQDQAESRTSPEVTSKTLRCLGGLCITPGCVVDLTHSKLAKLYGICRCVVQECTSMIDNAPVSNNDDLTAVRITQKTTIHVSEVQSWECFQLMSRLSGMGKEALVAGLDQERQQLADLLRLPKELATSQGVLLRGPPGCGKSSLVRQVAKDCQAALLEVSGPQVLSAQPGESESNLTALCERAVRVSKEVPCLLFMDDAEALCPRRGRSGSGHGSRLTTALLTLLDRLAPVTNLLVVMATNRPSALDPDIRRPGRMDREILVSVPNSSQRREIFSLHLGKVCVDGFVDLDWLSCVTPGYVGADIAAVCTEAQRKAFYRNWSQSDSSADVFSKCSALTQADLEGAVMTFAPSLTRGVDSVVDTRSVLWSDIGGLDAVKLQIQQAVEWPLLYPDTYRDLGIPLTKGVLLYGPPGCGKTTLVQAAATACHVTFLTLSCAQLYSPYVGDSEKKVTETFQKARALAPSILFLDEVDSIVGKRSQSSGPSGSGVSERVLSALLNEMDGVGLRVDDKTDATCPQMEAEGETTVTKPQYRQAIVKHSHDSHVLVVAATNRPDMLDPALLRPGRMDRLIYVPPPDLQGRLQSLQVHTRTMPLSEDVDLAVLAESTQGYTGADIKALCKEAGLLALKDCLEAESVQQHHFTAALTDCKPSLPSHTQDVYRGLKR